MSKTSEVASYVNGLSGFFSLEAGAAPNNAAGGGGGGVIRVAGGLEDGGVGADREPPDRGGSRRAEEVANVRGRAQRDCRSASGARKEGLRIVQEVSSLLLSNPISDALGRKTN
ncbi:hypothetical protein CH063_02123 [Colletotrichum higginsianum]|uniref:Uncharacterized protein n=1 Tax=Colletotrichum higginsianum (strain IMI 349063) TaxID=759273 RepID=H1VGQ3_COLHI|nr:hypothetical protein CH063_02123 [Colletotrichum higginsianum]